jgi:peroxiredoxin Q/BCP
MRVLYRSVPRFSRAIYEIRYNTIRTNEGSIVKAPNFTLPDQNGNMHSLADYANGWLVLYFYPEDDTPGCTTEACAFRDAREVIAELGNTQVVGVSKDSVDSHKKFADKYNLAFTLLSNPSHDTLRSYHSWSDAGMQRNTYIINPNGEIVKEYKNVNPEEHVAEIIKDLKVLQGRS